MRVTLHNGLVVEGDSTVLTQFVATLPNVYVDDGVHYNSESRGIISISTMADEHIRNAFLKLHRAWVQELENSTGSEFTQKAKQPPSPKTCAAFLKTLSERALKTPNPKYYK